MTTRKKKPARQASHDLSSEQLNEMYRDMLEQRRLEEHAARAYGMGRIYGFCHLYIGQEAISTGCSHAMGPNDIMVSAYRIHAQALALGVPPQEVMDELFGRETGNVHGLGGSMHMFAPDKGFWGGWGLVGQQVPMAVGVGFAQRYRGTGGVTIVLFGDGALQQGAIHEAFNMASIWDVPIVFVLENNQFGMGTAISRVSALEPAHAMAESYKLRHASVDGMNVIETYGAFSDAIEYARAESRPTFLEMRCSRFRGHSMSDPGKYRTKEELEEEKSRDPIPRLAKLLIEKGYATRDGLEALDKETKAAMKEVLARAGDAPWPEPARIHEFVYKTTIS